MRIASVYRALTRLVIAIVFGMSPPAIASQSSCTVVVQEGQFGKIELCASSTLRSKGKNKYAPGMAGDGDPATAWVEGVPGLGHGQWIEFILEGPAKVQTLEIVNGYAKSKASFRNNARIRAYRISVDDTPIHEGILKDTTARQQIRLGKPHRGTIWRLTVLDTYDGKRWEDLAVSEIWIDLEEHNYEFADEGDSPPSTTSDANQDPPALPDKTPAATRIDRNGILALQVLLKRLGYDPGALDGKDTDQLRSAIIAYQSVRGDVPDGTPSTVLRDQLIEAIKAKQ
ncbi:MAG: hypothetical protein GY947_02920 [Rhodobacteraceae bacterium]|nr:hypothetical protein [Paracoccaceae bacterium]